MDTIKPSVCSRSGAWLLRPPSRWLGSGAVGAALIMTAASSAIAQKPYRSSMAGTSKLAQRPVETHGAGVAPTPATPAVPYSMRGVPLGITLAEFRALPVPNDDGAINVRNLCTTDEPITGSWLEQVDREDVKNGIVTCNWFGKVGYLDSQLYIALGEGRGSPAFDFVLDGTQERLFRIRFYANAEYSSAIRSGLTSRYGDPVVTNNTVRTGTGSEFNAPTLTWSNGVSSITLESPCRRIDRYCLTYRHAALYKFYEAIRARRAAAAAEKF